MMIASLNMVCLSFHEEKSGLTMKMASDYVFWVDRVFCLRKQKRNCRIINTDRYNQSHLNQRESDYAGKMDTRLPETGAGTDVYKRQAYDAA